MIYLYCLGGGVREYQFMFIVYVVFGSIKSCSTAASSYGSQIVQPVINHTILN